MMQLAVKEVEGHFQAHVIDVCEANQAADGIAGGK